MDRGRSPCNERGASILELALLMPLMVLLVMGVLDLSRAYRLQIQLENAAREGAAYARSFANDVSCASKDDIEERVVNEEAGVDGTAGFQIRVLAEDAGGNLTVPVTGCGGTTASGGERLRIEVSAAFDILTPMVERAVGDTITITGSAEVVVQR